MIQIPPSLIECSSCGDQIFHSFRFEGSGRLWSSHRILTTILDPKMTSELDLEIRPNYDEFLAAI